MLQRIRRSLPSIQTVHTYSSPSAAEWPGCFGADRSDYIPLDEPGPTADVLGALKPAILVYSRGDLWPELTIQAAQKGVPIAVIGAEIRTTSRRWTWRSSSFVRLPLERITWLGAVSNDDAGRWRSMGVPESAIAVTGDPRHDRAIERISDSARLNPLLAANPTLVAGSTDARDEQVILEAFRELLRDRPNLRTLLAPHRPDAQHVQNTLGEARRMGMTSGAWRVGDDAPQASLLVITSLGLLADLYALADVAYVGGGFKKKGLHTVLEPAAFGVPVIVGPEYRHFRDAELVINSGGGVSLSRKSPAQECFEQCQRWLEFPDERTVAGLAARRSLEAGAAETTARALLALIR